MKSAMHEFPRVTLLVALAVAAGCKSDSNSDDDGAGSESGEPTGTAATNADSTGVPDVCEPACSDTEVCEDGVCVPSCPCAGECDCSCSVPGPECPPTYNCMADNECSGDQACFLGYCGAVPEACATRPRLLNPTAVPVGVGEGTIRAMTFANLDEMGTRIIIARGTDVIALRASGGKVLFSGDADIVALAVGDLDGDGDPEIVVGDNAVPAQVTVWTRTSTAPETWTAGATAQIAAAEIVLVDKTNDDKLDLLVRASTGVAIAPGVGDGTLMPIAGLVTGGVGSFTLLEYDGDTAIDVAFSDLNGYHVLRGGLNQVDPLTGMLDGPSTQMVSGDFNGDGIADIIDVRASGTLIGWRGPLSSTAGAQGHSGLTPMLFAKAVDLDHDMHFDLVLVDNNGNAKTIYGTADQIDSRVPLQCEFDDAVTPSAKAIAVGDQGDDGAWEIAVSNGNQVVMWRWS